MNLLVQMVRQIFRKVFTKCIISIRFFNFVLSKDDVVKATIILENFFCSRILSGNCPKLEIFYFHIEMWHPCVDMTPCSPRPCWWLTLVMGSKSGDQWGRCGPTKAASTTSLCTTNTIFMSLKWDLLLYFITKNRIRKCKQDPTGLIPGSFFKK